MTVGPRPATTPRQTEEGRQIYERRMAQNMRQSDVAARLGIHPGRISEWEQGQRPIPDEIRKDLLDALSKPLTQAKSARRSKHSYKEEKNG